MKGALQKAGDTATSLSQSIKPS